MTTVLFAALLLCGNLKAQVSSIMVVNPCEEFPVYLYPNPYSPSIPCMPTSWAAYGLPTGCSMDPLTGIIMLMPTEPSTSSVIVEFWYPCFGYRTHKFDLTITEHCCDYKFWEDNHKPYGRLQLSGDEDGDGLPNLVEFALGTSPVDASDGNGEFDVTFDAAKMEFQIVVKMAPFMSGHCINAGYVSVGVQTSADMKNWTNFATTPVITKSGYKDQFTFTIPASPSRRFVRFAVTLP